MTNPPPPGDWTRPDVAGPAVEPARRPDPGGRQPDARPQPDPADPYAPTDPYARPQPPADPYAGAQPGYPASPAARLRRRPATRRGYPAYGYPQPPKTNGLAIAALDARPWSASRSAASPAPVGAILGHVARKQIRRDAARTATGMAHGRHHRRLDRSPALLVLVIAFYVVADRLRDRRRADDSSSSY